MKLLVWLLLTIQFRSFKAYAKLQLEQKRRQEEFEPPYEKDWSFFFRKIAWSWKHKAATTFSPKDIPEMCSELTDKICNIGQGSGDFSFKTIGHVVRLSGQTIVIDERYAINPAQNGGVYVHERSTLEGEWEPVYRTYWLRKSIQWIPLLELLVKFKINKYIGVLLDKENSSNTTLHAVPDRGLE